MTSGVCAPYTFAKEFQRIRECVSELCGGISPSSCEVWDVRPPARVLIEGSSFVEIVSYQVPAGMTVWFFQGIGSVVGLSAEIVIEKYDDLNGWSLVRSYVVNTQSPSFRESLVSPIAVPDYNGNSIIRVRGRMNGGAGRNLRGTFFASMNGFMTPIT